MTTDNIDWPMLAAEYELHARADYSNSTLIDMGDALEEDYDGESEYIEVSPRDSITGITHFITVEDYRIF